MKFTPEQTPNPFSDFSDEERMAIAIISTVFGSGIVEITHNRSDGTQQTVPFDISKFQEPTED